MKIVDIDFNEIVNFDETQGHFIVTSRIKEDAIPVDGVTKLIHPEEDYELIKMFIVDSPEERISKLKQKLASTDYCILKISEGAATIDDYAEVIAQRAEWRKQINELESV